MLSKINYSTLVRFSIPSVLAALVEPLASVVDTAIVGRYSTSMLAVLAICVVVFNSLSWIFNFLVHTSTQKIADFSAQQNMKILSGRVFISLTMALLVSFVAVLLMIFFKNGLYILAGASPELFDQSDQYFLTRIYGHPFTLLFMTSLAIVRGFGHVKYAFYITAFSTLLNMALSYLFLYQFNFGIQGVALGTVLSHVLGFFSCLWYLVFIKSELFKSIFSNIPPLGEWVHFGKNGLDVFGRSLSLTGAFFLATRFAAELDKNHLAAHQILLQLWLFCSFFIDGLATSANILMSHYYGKKDLKNARIITRMFVVISAVFGLVFMLGYLLAGKFFIGLFSTDQLVLKICLSIFPMIAVSQLISSIAFIYDGVLFGLEKFAYLRKYMMLGVLFVFLPISGISQLRGTFVWIWLGLISLNIYRVLISHRLIKRELV